MTDSAAKQDASTRWTLLDVLPQKPPMVLLDSIVSHTSEETVCSVRIDPASKFASADGSIPSWIALEYMAQCAAAHSGLEEREKGNPIRLGFLLGSRRLNFHVASFAAEANLQVSVRPAWNDGELASFSCSVRDEHGAVLADCELSAYSPHDLQDLLARQNA